jgi:hypothetical protein
MFWLDLTGVVASIAGVIITLYTLRAAKGAREAAQAAARAAELTARRRNLVEELDDVSSKLQQLGHFLGQDQWIGVQIRTAEILSVCSAALKRWSDQLSEERRDEVLQATTLVHSIGTTSAKFSAQQLPTSTDRRRLADTHLKASQLLNGALGEARRREERGHRTNGN